jgi:hypothetical protein
LVMRVMKNLSLLWDWEVLSFLRYKQFNFSTFTRVLPNFTSVLRLPFTPGFSLSLYFYDTLFFKSCTITCSSHDHDITGCTIIPRPCE